MFITLENLNACPDRSVYGRFNAFLWKAEHQENQEPFYVEQSYKVYEDSQSNQNW